jgi:hypothetical protein
VHANIARRGVDTGERHAEFEPDAVGLHAAADGCRGIGRLAREHLGRLVQHRHGRAEARERLCEFAPDRPGPDDQQTFGRSVSQSTVSLVR